MLPNIFDSSKGLINSKPEASSDKDAKSLNKKKVDVKSTERNKETNSFERNLKKSLRKEVNNLENNRGSEERSNKFQRNESPRITPPANLGDNIFGKNSEKQAMIDFMSSLENKLGINPEKMIIAMKSLSLEDQKKAPEQTMAKVLSKLDLDKEGVEEAATLYAELLVNMSLAKRGNSKGKEVNAATTANSGNNFKSNAAVGVGISEAFNRVNGDVLGGKSGITNSVKEPSDVVSKINSSFNSSGLSPDQLRRQGQQKAVDKMNNDFFNTGDTARQEWNKEIAQVKSSLTKSNALESEEAIANGSKLGENGGVNAEMLKSMKKVNGSEYKNLLGNMNTPKENTSVNQFSQNLQSSNNQQSSLLAANTNSANSGFDGNSGFSQGNSFQSNSSNDGAQLSDDNSFSNSELTNESSFEQVIGKEGFSAQLAGKSSALSSAGLSAMGSEAATGMDAENIQEVIGRAQILAKDGGGELKVQLNPNNLGQVDLKVSVENGQVNIQMVAENPEAKSALEKGIGDLKSDLAINKLNLEAVKIDVGTDMSQNFEEKQSEAEKTYAREYARDFMGSFRDGNQSSRQGFLNDDGTSEYMGQDRQEVNPLSTENDSSEKAKKRGGLHLVG